MINNVRVIFARIIYDLNDQHPFYIFRVKYVFDDTIVRRDYLCSLDGVEIQLIVGLAS